MKQEKTYNSKIRTIPEWEKQYWEIVHEEGFDPDWTLVFIDNLLKTQRKELLDSIEEEIEHLWTKPNYQLGGNYENDEHYNQALSEVLKIIKIKQ